MNKTATIENKFRNNEPVKSSRNIIRKSKTDTVSFTEKVTEQLKPEIKEKVINRTKDNVVLKVGDYCEYFHGNNQFKCIVQVIATNQNLRSWSDSYTDIRVLIIDNLNSPYYSDHGNVNLRSDQLNYLKEYIAPEITKINVTKDSLKNMKFINYNKFIVEGILVDYSYSTTIKDSSISCGVKQYSVINDLFNYNKFKYCFCKKHTEFNFQINKSDYCKIFCKNVMDNIFKTYTKAGFLIISTNETGNNEFKRIDKLLTSYDFISFKDTVNPNTNNNIRFWTCNLFEYQKTLSIDEKKSSYVSINVLNKDDEKSVILDVSGNLGIQEEDIIVGQEEDRD